MEMGEIILTTYAQDICEVNQHMPIIVLSQTTSNVKANSSYALGLTTLDEVDAGCKPEDIESRGQNILRSAEGRANLGDVSLPYKILVVSHVHSYRTNAYRWFRLHFGNPDYNFASQPSRRSSGPDQRKVLLR